MGRNWTNGVLPGFPVSRRRVRNLQVASQSETFVMGPNHWQTFGIDRLRVFDGNFSFWSDGVLGVVLALWAVLIVVTVLWRVTHAITVWWKTPPPTPPLPPPPPAPRPTRRQLVRGAESQYEEQCTLIDESPLLKHEKKAGKKVMRERLLNRMDDILRG